MAHNDVKFSTLKDSNEGLVKAINDALADANIKASDIDCVFGFANGDSMIDNEEKTALSKVFNNLDKLPIVNVKEHVGEARSAAAALQFAHASLLLSGELESTDAYLVSNKVSKTNVSGKDLNKVLVIAYGFGGSYTAVVLEK